jgi:hypothetical protein
MEAPLLTTWRFILGLVSLAAAWAPIFGSDVLERGDVQKIDALLAQGVDVNTKGKSDVTPLAWAMIAKNKAGFERLLQKGADPNHFVWDSVPIIQLAALDEETSDWLRLCLKYKGNPNVVNRCEGIPDGQQTPIYWAFRSRRMESVDLLIQAGANLTHRDHSGRTPLLEAQLERGFEWAHHLLEQGADFRIGDSAGRDLAFEAMFISPELTPGDEPQVWRDRRLDYLESHGADFGPAEALIAKQFPEKIPLWEQDKKRRAARPKAEDRSDARPGQSGDEKRP